MINIKGKILDSNHKYKRLTQDVGKVLIVEIINNNIVEAFNLILDFMIKNPVEILLKSYIILRGPGGDTVNTLPLSTLYASVENNNIKSVGCPPMFTIDENLEGIDVDKLNIAYKKILSFLGK